MHHFFVPKEQIIESRKEIRIMGSDYNHIRNVLRMQVGEMLSISNGEDGQIYLCEIREFLEEEVVLTISSAQEDSTELPAKVYLFQGLPKSDKMELIVQKATELGVYEIIPVATTRCVVKLDEKKAKTKVKRWQTIAESAAKQSKRSVIPNIASVQTYGEAMEYAKNMDMVCIPYELTRNMDGTKEFIKELQGKCQIGIFIGPEGGFSEEEINFAIENQVKPISLGKRILRTETAGLTTLAIIMYHLEILNI